MDTMGASSIPGRTQGEKITPGICKPWDFTKAVRVLENFIFAGSVSEPTRLAFNFPPSSLRKIKLMERDQEVQTE